MNRFRSLAAALLLVASGCSSHGSGMLPQTESGSSSSAKPLSGKTAATLSIQVPRPGTSTLSKRRTPKYVSPSSTQLQVAVNGGTPTAYGLTTQSPGCSVQVATLSCTFSIPAPVGPDTFTLTLEDAAGNALSKNVVSATLTAGQSTPVNVTLAGIPVAVQLVPGLNSHVEGGGNPSWHVPGLSPQMIEAEPLDADNNVIIGPGAPTITQVNVTTGSAFATAAPAGNGDPEAYVLSPVGASAGGQTVTVSATAQGIALSDGTTSAPITTSTSFMFTPAIAVGASNLISIYSVETGNFITQFTCRPQCAGGSFITGMASDSNGGLYVATTSFVGFGASSVVWVFAPGAITPTTALGSSNGVHRVGALTVDKNGMLYVANVGGFGFHATPANIVELPKGATTPSVTITGGVSSPSSLGVDGSGNVYLVDSAQVEIFGPGNQTGPSQTISDPSLVTPYSIAIDSAGDFYVSDVNSGSQDIAYFAAGSTTHTNILTDPSFQNWSGSAPLMLDPSGNLWVATLTQLERFDATALPNSLFPGKFIGNPQGINMAWIP